jgi:hypothetical protein
MSFEEARLQGVAAIDFDRLGGSSSKLMPKLLGMIFSGTHVLSARGELISRDGKGRFRLERASFDDSTLPRYLIEHIITLVGKKQNPPFDPLQLSALPYGIERVDVHPGYLIVYQ